MALPKQVQIVEVGPRDGLQNEPLNLPDSVKIEFINRLSASGLTHIESGSFVSPEWVPQMTNSTEVFKGITRNPATVYSALTPNLTGLHAAIDAGVDQVAVFTAASERFSEKNINCSIAESIRRFEPVLQIALDQGLKVRGYISCALGCPYQGHVPPKSVAKIASQLYQMGCYEISLGDTIGTGTPQKAIELINAVSEQVPVQRLAAHFHDTYGQALVNLYAVLTMGVRTIDSSVAGLGGCPYAPGAAGNVASEDVLYLLNGLGIETGISLDKLIETGDFICHQLQRPSGSKVALSGYRKPKRSDLVMPGRAQLDK